ncbi:MAG: hypothetical protein ABL967_15180 [Bryobacteraceae bacterium]
MRPIAILLALACTLFAADKKQVSGYGEAGNDNADFIATVHLDPGDIHDILGADLPPGYVLAKVKAKVKTGDALRLSPDDFVLVSRKNGDRADAIAPSQITSTSALTIRRDQRGRDWAQQTNEPGFVGVGSIKRAEGAKEDTALLTALRDKQFPDKDIKDTAEGLIYFSLDVSKLRAKDLALIYKGKAGRVSMDFK